MRVARVEQNSRFSVSNQLAVAANIGRHEHLSHRHRLERLQRRDELGESHAQSRIDEVRAKNIGRDIAAGFKNIIGGELKGYSELLSEARQEAFERMVQQAEAKGANAVINVRFTTSSVAQAPSKVCRTPNRVPTESR